MTYTPIIIPASVIEDKCPKCNKDENIIEVCAHCGYEYKEEPTRWYDWVVPLLVVVVGIWALCTVIVWIIDSTEYGDKRSLWEIIVMQWDFIKSLKMW